MSQRTLQEKEILKEQVRQLYGLAPLGFIATLMNATIVFFVMRDVIAQPFLLFWLASVLLLTLVRAAMVLYFRRAEFSRFGPATWCRWFNIGLFAIGLAWGSISFTPFAFSLSHQVFIAFVLGGMAAGASSTYSKVKFGYLAYSIPTLLPLAVRFLALPDVFHSGMSLMTFLFFILLWRIAEHNYSVNRTSLLLRFENAGMLETLRRAKEDVEALNAQLVAEIQAKHQAEAELRSQQDDLERTVLERTGDLRAANELLRTEIEERKEIEKALRESRERLDLAQRAGRVGVFDWDMSSGRVIRTGQLQELFGLEPGEVEGTYQSWASMVHPDDMAELEALMPVWLANRLGEVDFEYRFRRGGEIRWMAASVRIAYSEDGTALRMVGSNVDVTESKEAQAKLTAAKEAAEAGSRAKSEFLANMSHEMRTPLAGVLGMIKLVLDMKIGDEERTLLEMARRSAESLLRLIADVLDFSRVEAGVMKFDRKRFAVAATVKSAVEVVSLSAREKGLELSWKVEAAVQDAEGDEGRLRQVLVNLLGNAVKFTERGSIEVTARPFADPEAGGRAFVLLAVHDTGVGIAAEQLESVFGKFTQIDSSLTRRYGGTGLGLALSKQLVEKGGGRIWVESREGAGSVFYFTIPAPAPAPDQS